MVERDGVSPGRERRHRRFGALLAGLVVLLLVIALPAAMSLLDDDGLSHRIVKTHDDGTQQVLAALAATIDSGSYDLTFTLHGDPGNAPSSAAPCAPVQKHTASGVTIVQCWSASTPSVDVTGHGTVNTDPYAMQVATDVSGLGPVTIWVDGTTVWEDGGANYGIEPNGVQPGRSLSGFAGLVEGTLGPGQGALSMISLANNSGYLGLEAEAVVSATTDGDGTLADGTHVRYFDVDVDITKMADGATLTDEQRQAIRDAVAVLQHAGYTGSDERLAIDDQGLIRDVVSRTKFGDGSSLTRHTQFSSFGCAPRVSLPNQPQDPTPTGPCTATTTTEAATAPSTTLEPSTTPAPEPTTSTSTAPTTAPEPTSTTG